MFAELENELDDIETVPISREKLALLTSEEDFTGLAVELLIETGSFTCVAASILPGDTKCWNRDQAIVGGNVVRLFKLISAILDQTCQHRRETTFIFTRLAFETIVNITYLIEHASPKLFDSYVRYSLRHEKKLRDRIRKNLKDRGGEELPIERRMLESIARTEKKSEVSLNDITSSTPKNWGGKNVFERAQEVGLDHAYLAAFGGGSHNVHGNWMDLVEYHLQEKDHGFGPQLEWQYPRPQNLYVIASLSVVTIGKYFRYVGGEELAKLVEAKLNYLEERIKQTDAAHEKYVTSRMDDKN